MPERQKADFFFEREKKGEVRSECKKKTSVEIEEKSVSIFQLSLTHFPVILRSHHSESRSSVVNSLRLWCWKGQLAVRVSGTRRGVEKRMRHVENRAPTTRFFSLSSPPPPPPPTNSHPLGQAPGPMRRQRGHPRWRRGRRLVLPGQLLLELELERSCFRGRVSVFRASTLPFAEAPPQRRAAASFPMRGWQRRPGAVGELRRR